MSESIPTTEAPEVTQAPQATQNVLMGQVGTAQQQAPPSDVSLSDVYLPDELRNDANLKDIRTVTDLAKSMINAQGMIGRDKIVLPGKDATDEDWQKVYEKLGRPQTPQDYGLKVSEELPQEAIPKERLDAFAQIAHQQGLTSRQAGNLIGWYQQQIASDLESVEQSKEKGFEESVAALQRDFGNAYDQKIKLANMAMQNAPGGPEALEAIKRAGLANDPAVVKFAAKLGEMMGEDRLVGLDERARGLTPRMTPQNAQLEIDKLHAHPAYLDHRHPEHKVIQQQLTELHKDRWPEKQGQA